MSGVQSYLPALARLMEVELLAALAWELVGLQKFVSTLTEHFESLVAVEMPAHPFEEAVHLMLVMAPYWGLSPYPVLYLPSALVDFHHLSSPGRRVLDNQTTRYRPLSRLF
jgi:hypothetical protein